MTAVQERPVTTPPRAVIRLFWMLHRAAYRVTGGRFGLKRPEAGARFGMLWLTTVGRKTGRTRRTMIGYIEDGPNLATIAMNGWGDTDPAWWLNLQADPDALVDLGTSDGARAVRARAATGEERDRLWATFARFPGWGDDLDGLAARRPGPTTVVVLEPRDGAAIEGRIAAQPAAGEGDAPSTVARAAGATGALAATTGGWRLRLRHLWLIPGLAIAVHANGEAQAHDLGLVPLLLFGIVPHLPSLIGMREARAPGHISRRAVPLFNAMHHPLLPLGIAGTAAAGLLSPFWLVGGLAWLSHIVIDLALAAGARTPDGAVQVDPVGRLVRWTRARVAAPQTAGIR